jgi:DNA-binding transcriptional regulator YiaG
LTVTGGWTVKKDFLDEIVASRTKRNPAFPRLVAEAEARRKVARQLAALRKRGGHSQTVVAARMGTSASVVSKLEAGADVMVSTLMRYCAAIGETKIPSMPLPPLPARRKASSKADHRQAAG